VRWCSAPLGAVADVGPARWRRCVVADDARLLDSGEQGGDPRLEAGQGFVPGREHPGGDQDVSEVVGAASAGVGVERGVADRCGAGGEVGEHGGAGTVAQPVQCGARGAGGGDGVVDEDQRGWDLLIVGVEQLTGAANQRAAFAPTAFVELVLEAAVGADVAGRQPSAVSASRRVRSWRADESPLGQAAAAGAAIAQRGGVAGVADRPLGSVRHRWPWSLRTARPGHPAKRRHIRVPRRGRATGRQSFAACAVDCFVPLPVSKSI